MKKYELKQTLAKKQLNYFFTLEGGLPNELYCLGENGNIWEVYYSERGTKSNLQTFQTEEEACKYLLLLSQNTEEKYCWFKSKQICEKSLRNCVSISGLK